MLSTTVRVCSKENTCLAERGGLKAEAIMPVRTAALPGNSLLYNNLLVARSNFIISMGYGPTNSELRGDPSGLAAKR